MEEATIQRPVTVPKLAEALQTKPYRILRLLIQRSIFPAPSDTIVDSLAVEIAAMANVELKIVEEGGQGTSRF
jgi:hypothetical protein